MERCWSSLVKNNTNHLEIYLNIFSRDNQTKKICFLNMKLAFINIGLQSSLL